MLLRVYLPWAATVGNKVVQARSRLAWAWARRARSLTRLRLDLRPKARASSSVKLVHRLLRSGGSGPPAKNGCAQDDRDSSNTHFCLVTLCLLYLMSELQGRFGPSVPLMT